MARSTSSRSNSVAFLGMVGLRRIAGRRANAAVFFRDQILGRQRLVGRVAPQFLRTRWCNRSAKASASRSASAFSMIEE